ncbi:poly(A) polymerase [Loktanella fryxellensis]|uniref:Poly(A) polymerase n=1 Tax=Loktanella fryxellensis TaxID=245187 RepID=A0A1H8DWA8_9RHOB|nr:CCA tRNA nucleotidyltransferase [Loktanella fryxellensis]SEN10837.1 poly(A) polymerase [Loktanella fryxellensis]
MRITPDWLTEPGAQAVCTMLTDAGHQAWFVGGCVRNALIGAGASDIDIATDAVPQTVSDLGVAAGFKVVPTGIDHGTVTVVVDGTPFEVTTFRRDVDTDGRHATVAFATTVHEDARRRDFTMNALYVAPDGTLCDPVGGAPDALAGHVRFIGDADARIREDYLRILRFFRFFAWYGDPDLGIDANGLAACAGNLDGIDRLSAERIGQEMRKLLAAADPAPAVASMAACGALWRVLPGAAPDALAVLVHLEGEAGLPPDAIRRLAALGGDPARLRLSNAEAARLEILRDTQISAGEAGYRHGETIAIDRIAVMAASLSQPIDPRDIAMARRGAGQVLPIRAADLMPALQGPALGAALKAAEVRWIASGFTLTRADLLG